jgi:hypothetical protein
VTWQSAFWSLIPLALNTMTQPAGMVCFLPSSFGTILRSSPLICLIDTVIILEQQIWLTITIHSPFTAASQFAQFRFQDAESDVAEDSLASLQRNTSFRIVIFIFGALPQMIKLYSMTGLLWTKVAGAAYMSSFAVIELLSLVAWKERCTGQSQLPRDTTVVEDYIGLTSVISSVLLAFYVFALGLISACQAYIDYFNWWHISLFILLVPVYLVSNLSRPQSEMLLSFVQSVSFFAAIFLGLGATASLSPEFLFSWLDPRVPGNGFNIIAAILSAHLALLLVGWAVYNIYKKANSQRLTFIKSVSLWTYLILHIDASLLYYAFGYDSEGTSKPAWADLLG